MSSYGMTITSQLRSANTEADIEFHSGYENREKYNHENKDIDTDKSKYNKCFIGGKSRDELLEEHYLELVETHNKNQRGKKNYWDGVQGYLETFEGKTVGKSKNERWATVSQISYFGNQESMDELFDDLKDAGISEQEIRDAYTDGCKKNIIEHNKEFPTLQIYREDIHFDEATPHVHDAIVPTGHTEKGRPSPTINNAISEWADSYGVIKADKDKGIDAVNNFTRMRDYRDKKDGIMFDAISESFVKLGTKHGLKLEFDPIRTEEVNDAKNSREYKVNKDFEAWGQELLEKEELLNTRSKSQKKNNQLVRGQKRDADKRDKLQDKRDIEQDAREEEIKLNSVGIEDIERKERLFDEKQKEKERLNELKEKELQEKQVRQDEINEVITSGVIALIGHDEEFVNPVNKLKRDGIADFNKRNIENVIGKGLENIRSDFSLRRKVKPLDEVQEQRQQQKDDEIEL